MISSPVYERGFLNKPITTSSILFPSTAITPKCNVWDCARASFLPMNTLSAISMALSPDIRITAIAPTPGAVLRATIVSLCSANCIFCEGKTLSPKTH